MPSCGEKQLQFKLSTGRVGHVAAERIHSVRGASNTRIAEREEYPSGLEPNSFVGLDSGAR